MKPEFEQILKGLGVLFYQDGILETQYLDKLLFQELMENTWNLAIEAAADNAELEGDEGNNVWIDKQSILKLKI